MRARARQSIEGLIRGELDAALARPRYEPSEMAGKQAGTCVKGHRHASPKRSLTRTFGPIELAVPRAPLTTPEGGTAEWKSHALRAYQRRTLAADALTASSYLAGTHTGRCVGRSRPRRDGRQGHGEPDLAQGEGRLGRLEQPLADRGADRA